MELPNWIDNDIKYQRALAEAKDPNNEAEVKAIYVSYGGKLIGEEVVLSEIKEEQKVEEEKIVVTPEVVAEVEAIAVPREEIVAELGEEAVAKIEEEAVEVEVLTETPVEELVAEVLPEATEEVVAIEEIADAVEQVVAESEVTE